MFAGGCGLHISGKLFSERDRDLGRSWLQVALVIGHLHRRGVRRIGFKRSLDRPANPFRAGNNRVEKHEQSKRAFILLNTDLAYTTFDFQRVNYAPEALLSAETGRNNLNRVAIRPGDYLNVPTFFSVWVLGGTLDGSQQETHQNKLKDPHKCLTRTNRWFHGAFLLAVFVKHCQLRRMHTSVILCVEKCLFSLSH